MQVLTHLIPRLRAGIHIQELQFAVGGGGGQDHAFGYAEFGHFARGEVGDGNHHAAVEFGGIGVAGGDAGENHALFEAEIEIELQQFGAAFYGLAVEHFGHAHIDFHKVVETGLFGDGGVLVGFGCRCGGGLDTLFVGFD